MSHPNGRSGIAPSTPASARFARWAFVALWLLPASGCVSAAFPDAGGHFANIAASGVGACAIDADGAATCWGVVGELPDVRWKTLSLEIHYGCGIDMDGTMFCWETELFDELFGDQHYGQSTARDGAWLAVETSSYHTCGLTAGGDLECWGIGEEGEVEGEHDVGQVRDAPVGEFRRIALNAFGGCVLGSDGEVRCWGEGFGLKFDDPGSAYVDLDLSGRVGCGVLRSGAVHCWDAEFTTEFGSLLWDDPGPFEQVSIAIFPCALETGGRVDCKGEDEPDGGWRCSPPAAVEFDTIEPGGRQVCGVTRSGGALCFGEQLSAEPGCTVGPPSDFFQ